MLALVLVSAPAQAVSRAKLLKRADEYYSLSLKEFTKVSQQHDGEGKNRKNEDTSWRGLNWRHNSCTGVPKPVKDYFRKSCVRHDFGYRNFGQGKDLTLRSTNAMKKTIDNKFLADMKSQCAKKRVGTRQLCREAADEMYNFVRSSFAGSSDVPNPENAFHNNACTTGALCLFDDTWRNDRRLTFGSTKGHATDSSATKVSNLKDMKFGDKTSSVVNKSKYAWRLYDDHNYKDRSVCVPPNTQIDDLGTKRNKKFGDKTSSIKRMSGSKC